MNIFYDFVEKLGNVLINSSKTPRIICFRLVRDLYSSLSWISNM